MAAQIESETKDNEKLLSEAKARFKLVDEAENETRAKILEDLKFVAGEQWDALMKAKREAEFRPCLTVNRISQHVKQITNDQRQNRPSIKVHPVDDKADPETAKMLSGMIRHIEYNSNADFAYDTGFDSAVRGGRGFWRIITDYVSPLSFDQEILIKRIRNSLSVFLDPHSKEADGSDAEYGFIVDDISKDEFLRKYPNANLSRAGEWDLAATQEPDWVKSDSVRVAEYFYKDFKEEEIALLSTGESIAKKDLPELLPEGVTIIKERSTTFPVIKWAKLNGHEVLEETDWPGSFIPIVPVYGEELDIDGKRILKGIVRDAKDPQKMLNVWKSAETEAIGLAPKAPFIVAEGQIEDYEEIWATANTASHSYLPYKPTSINGTPVPPPQRQTFEPAVQAITQAAMLAADDLKATTGIFDASLGAQSNETSGIAIQRRNNQAQTSNFHFVDNLTRSIRHTGRILVDLIPKIYDTARVARIIGEDGTTDIIKVNEPFMENGKPVLYDLSAGKYDVTVDVGPSFATKRQEAVASMLDVVKAYPQLAQFAGDLLVKQMDWPGAQEFADRIKKTLPPGLAEDPKQAQPLPPAAKAQLEQQGAMIESLTAKLNLAHDERDQKLLELESKERIEMAKLETTATVELAKLESKEAITLLAHQIAELDQRTKMLAFNEPIEGGQGGEYEESEEYAPANDGAEMPQVEPMQEDLTGEASPGLPTEGPLNQ